MTDDLFETALRNAKTDTVEPRVPAAPVDPGGSLTFNVSSIPARFVGNDPTSPGVTPGIADIDPSFVEYLATGLFGGLLTFGERDADGNVGEILYWSISGGTIDWQVIEEPGTPGGFKLRYYVPTSLPSIADARLVSTAVPVVDIFRLAATLSYSLDRVASVRCRVQVLWYDEAEQLIAVTGEPTSTNLPATQGKRSFLTIPLPAAVGNAVYAALQLDFGHASNSASAIFDLHGVLLKQLYPPESVLDPDGFLMLANLDAPPNTGRDVFTFVTLDGIPIPERVIRHLRPGHVGEYAVNGRLWRIDGTTQLARPLGFSGANAYATSSWSVSNNAWGILYFANAVKVKDTDNYFGSGSGFSVVASPFTGMYVVSAGSQFAANSSGDRGIRIVSKDQGGNTTVWATDTRRARSSGATHCSIGGIQVPVQRGDTISVEIFQDSGSLMEIIGNRNTFVSVRFED